MNAGLGFRFDLTFLILRIDAAKPLRIPFDNTVANKNVRIVLAFGYPF